MGNSFKDETARLPYAPIATLKEKADAIPTGSIFNLVREDQPDKPVLISHQGFIIQKPEGTFVRHAAFDKTVEDVLLSDYLKKYDGSKWPILGMNFNAAQD